MKTFAVGEFKTHFSEIIERVRSGEEIIITDGKKKEKVAVVVPYAAYETKRIRLGLLQDRSIKIHDDFKMTGEKML
jgi:prevent-host-death family protein